MSKSQTHSNVSAILSAKTKQYKNLAMSGLLSSFKTSMASRPTKDNIGIGGIHQGSIEKNHRRNQLSQTFFITIKKKKSKGGCAK